jgi:hypothetical protein
MKTAVIAGQLNSRPGQGNAKVKSRTTEGKLGHFTDESPFAVG